MLPTVKTFKTSAIAGLLALSLAVPAAPAFAWDDREQGILTGVLGTLAVGAIINEANKPKQRVIYGATKSSPVYGNGYGNGYGNRSGYGNVHGNGNGYGYQQPRRAQVDVHSSAAALAFNSYTSSERRTIQRDLARRGFYNGTIDGQFGPATFRATAAYARATGNLDLLSTRNGAYGIYDSLV